MNAVAGRWSRGVLVLKRIRPLVTVLAARASRSIPPMPSRRRSGVTKRNLSQAVSGRRSSITNVAAATGRSSHRPRSGRTRRCLGANSTSARNSDTGIGRSPGITSLQNPATRSANNGHSGASASASQTRSTIGRILVRTRFAEHPLFPYRRYESRALPIAPRRPLGAGHGRRGPAVLARAQRRRSGARWAPGGDVF